MIAVSVDTDLAQAAKVVAKQNWTHTRNMAIEFDKLKDIGVSVVPITIIIARDGTITTMAGSHALDIEREVEALLITRPAQDKSVEP